ncbi:MAG: formimidoylglutamate deiminase [Phreatobacter sp.]|uniref:formimidoylglutamate deiminase n=1 Tax=Phreatobacter sp. TaxID=1966341 RepID=UPI001A5F33F7|nr:formimidoylglutamate deiminase [Phreatobacter sp.]MBL8567990.1 formimidoylglutamate deiminase [Phreatobacter sp.]
MPRLHAPRALLPDGWARDVRIDIDAHGDIVAIAPGVEAGDGMRVAGIVVPGMPDLHSHAFQRAMAGLTERAGPAGDSFWSWRDLMYRFLDRLGPVEVEAIAAQVYVELLRHGYTAVAEFHYLHNDRDGGAYEEPTALCDAICAAAGASGIGLTLLPVLYQSGGFGGAAPLPAQRRFLLDDDRYARLVETLLRRHRGDRQIRIGIAPHSLRAVAPEALRRAVDHVTRLDPRAPIHIHVAEQLREVEQCLAWSGARPVAWLLDNAAIDGRWCAVHATHMDTLETGRLAASGAVAGICPTTEGNLGDGLFALGPYVAAGGVLGIGSDSNVSVSPVEELRWLEYGQRLTRRARNLFAPTPGASTGAALYRAALAGGARACARPIGALAPGHRADLVVLDADHPVLLGRDDDALLDAWIFAGNDTPVRDVMVGGHWLVREGRHVHEAQARADFGRAVARLMQSD